MTGRAGGQVEISCCDRQPTACLSHLVDLPPFSSFSLHEVPKDARHDLIEVLEVVGSSGNLLHQCRRCSPWIVRGGLIDLGFDLGDVESVVLGLPGVRQR